MKEIADISKIPASQMIVLNTGQCLCLSSDCTLQDCGNGVVDPNAPAVVAAIQDYGGIHMKSNVYSVPGKTARFTDRRAGSLGVGFDGVLSDRKVYSKNDNFSMETLPLVNTTSFHLLAGSSCHFAASKIPSVSYDFYHRPVLVRNGLVDIGVLFSNSSAPQPTLYPTFRPTTLRPTLAPSMPTMKVSMSHSPVISPSWSGQEMTVFQNGVKMNNGAYYKSSYDINISNLYAYDSSNYYND